VVISFSFSFSFSPGGCCLSTPETGGILKEYTKRNDGILKGCRFLFFLPLMLPPTVFFFFSWAATGGGEEERCASNRAVMHEYSLPAA